MKNDDDGQQQSGLFEQDEWAKARAALLWKLSRRELSVREARDWLRSKGYEEEVASQAIEAALEWRAIDEERLLGAIVRAELRKGRGPAVIRVKLRQRGLTVSESSWRTVYETELLEFSGVSGRSNISNNIMMSGDDSESEASAEASDRRRALELVERRYPSYRDDPRMRQKAFQFLVRRGFPLSKVSDWLRS